MFGQEQRTRTPLFLLKDRPDVKELYDKMVENRNTYESERQQLADKHSKIEDQIWGDLKGILEKDGTIRLGDDCAVEDNVMFVWDRQDLPGVPEEQPETGAGPGN